MTHPNVSFVHCSGTSNGGTSSRGDADDFYIEGTFPVPNNVLYIEVPLINIKDNSYIEVSQNITSELKRKINVSLIERVYYTTIHYNSIAITFNDASRYLSSYSKLRPTPFYSHKKVSFHH